MITQIKKRLHRLFSIGIGWNEISQYFPHVELDKHVVRNDSELNRIRQYIIDNPANWEKDRYFSG